MTWDTVVVGSGPGGLTAAVALARAGQKVLVLEQHYLPGGWAHSFVLEGYRFSPGIHYVGDLQEGGGLRAMLDGLGLLDDLEFNQLNPDGFDHFIISGERFDQPKGLDRWIARLKERFPAQHQGIDRYFGVVRKITFDLKKGPDQFKFPAVLAVPFKSPSILRWGFSTLGALLDKTITDPLLRAVLSAQAGNHGLPPSRVSLPAHAMMTDHYFNGGWYPKGGAKAIPRACMQQLREHGGRLRVRARVKRVLVEDGKVCGVELDDGERIDAGQVVCNADPAIVYTQLLDEKYCRSERRQVAKMEYSGGLVSAFCAVEMELQGLGYDSGNYWSYRDADLEGTYARAATVPPGDELDALFLSITSLKDPGHAPPGQHTVELLTFAPWRMFDGRARDEAYLAVKRELGEKMLAAAERVIPGFRANLRFFEVGTPLTNMHYCNVWKGAAYGTAKTPWQVGPFSFSQRGPVPGLHLCGASTLSHGFAGAAMSGLIAAQQVLGLERPEALIETAPAHGLQPVHA